MEPTIPMSGEDSIVLRRLASQSSFTIVSLLRNTRYFPFAYPEALLQFSVNLRFVSLRTTPTPGRYSVISTVVSVEQSSATMIS